MIISETREALYNCLRKECIYEYVLAKRNYIICILYALYYLHYIGAIDRNHIGIECQRFSGALNHN